MKRYTVLLLLTLCFIQCRKDDADNELFPNYDGPKYDGISCESDCFIVEGQVTLAQTGEPITNLILDFHAPVTYFGGGELLIVDQTDENGEYRFNIPSDFDNGSPSLFAFTDATIYVNDSLDKVEYINLDPDSVDIPQRFDFHLYEMSELYVHVVCETEDWEFVKVSCDFAPEDITDIGYSYTSGEPFDTVLVFRTPSDIPTTIQWHLWGDDVNDEEGEYEIVIPGGEIGEHWVTL